jgi:hypothetical protein
VRAGSDGDVVLGAGNVATAITSIANTTNGQTVFQANSTSGVGVSGLSTSNYGVAGHSDTNIGVAGFCASGYGVYGYSDTNIGVYGYCAGSTSPKGVVGETTTGHGVHGIATTGYAGYFAGKVYTSKWYEMTEVTTPAAPSANRARLFARDNGLGKTQLCVRFPTGAIQVIKTEP